MADIPARARLSRGTAAQWATANPILQSGEPGFETDTNVLRIGNGTSPFSALVKMLSEAALPAAMSAAFLASPSTFLVPLGLQNIGSVADLNTLDDNQFFETQSGVTLNTPSLTRGYLGLHLKMSANFKVQLAIRASTPDVYVRSYDGTLAGWSVWHCLNGFLNDKTNLNTLTTGFSFIRFTNTATGAPNGVGGLAAGSAYTAVGYQFGDGSRAFQAAFVPGAGNLLLRTYSGTWGPWVSLVSSDNLVAMLRSSLANGPLNGLEGSVTFGNGQIKKWLRFNIAAGAPNQTILFPQAFPSGVSYAEVNVDGGAAQQMGWGNLGLTSVIVSKGSGDLGTQRTGTVVIWGA